MRPITRLCSVFVITILADGSALAAKRDIEELKASVDQLSTRVQQLEVAKQNQMVMELMHTVEQLQTEVQQLRGDLEQLSHDVERMGERQRNLYLDIDRRLNDMQFNGSRSSVSTADSAAQTQQDGAVPRKPRVTTISNVPAEKNEQQIREAYSMAFAYLKEGRYAESISAFQSFLSNYSASGYNENAQYWLGEANYASKNFTQALIEFNKVLERFPGSAKVAGAKLKLGYTYYELERWKEARDILDDVVRNYAGSSVAPLAEKRLIKMTQEGH